MLAASPLSFDLHMLPWRSKVGYSLSSFLSPSCLPGLAVIVRSHGKLKWGPLVQKLRILRWRQENSKSSVGPLEHGVLCDFSGHIPNCPEWRFHVLWSSNLGKDMDVICAIIMEELPFFQSSGRHEVVSWKKPSQLYTACLWTFCEKQTNFSLLHCYISDIFFKMTKQEGKEGCVWIPFSFSCCRRICTSPASMELTFGTWPYW